LGVCRGILWSRQVHYSKTGSDDGAQAVWIVQLPNGQQHGPLSRAEVESLLGCGAIPSVCAIRNVQDAAWLRASDLFPPITATCISEPSPIPAKSQAADQGNLGGDGTPVRPVADSSLAGLFDHVNRSHEQRDAEKRNAEKEIRRIAHWVGGVVGVALAGILGSLIVVDLANGGRHNFAAVASIPVIAAGIATAIATWLLPNFYSSLRKRH
jgi:hypothetical protein